MSYDIRLVDPVTRIPLYAPGLHHISGGTFAVGGTTRLWLNVTWNYSPYFCRVIDESLGIRAIYGQSGAASIPLLTAAIAKLGDDVDENYWKPTEGNAKRALCQLLALAQLRPDGIWDGD